MISRGAALLGVVALYLDNPCAGADPVKELPSFELPSNTVELRAYYLDDIDLLRDYRPGKVSYVESPERRLGHYRAPGDRFTLLDVQGVGSIRHLWSTFQPGKGQHQLDIYLDGAEAPAWSGTMTQLIDRARNEAAVPIGLHW